MLDVTIMPGVAPTLTWKKPTDLAPAPLASGVPTVRKFDVCTGGAHDEKARGGPCVLFGAVHWSYAGTSATRSGVAPLGRGCVAPALHDP
jgi:hypothetical protein